MGYLFKKDDDQVTKLTPNYYSILSNFNPSSSLVTLDTVSVNHITDEKKNYEDIL